MKAPLTALDWLMSAYDATWHAFPAAQLAGPTRTFYQALREHSVPARYVEHTAPRVFAPPAWCSTARTSPTTSAGRWAADPMPTLNLTAIGTIGGTS